MDRDPDYIDPKELRRRAAQSGGVRVKPGRPLVKRVPDAGNGLRIVKSTPVLKGLKFISSGMTIEKSDKVRITR